jgi:hypothetical protein
MLTASAVRAQTTFVLRIQGSPTNFSAPTPLGYGTWTNIADNTWLTNSVASPASNSTVCCVSTGWTAAYTNGSNIIGDGSTQAVFRLTNNVVLTWYWTNSGFYLALTAAPNGSLTPDMTGWYTNGTQVVVSATGNTGYVFSQWTGDVPSGGHTNNPLTVPMDRARAIQANFASNSPQTKIWTGTNNWASATNWNPAGMPGSNDTAIIQSGLPTLSDPVRVLHLTNSGGTLRFSGWGACLEAGGNVTVASGRTIDHVGPITNETVTNRVHIICSNLTVAGSINVSYCGYYLGGTYRDTGYGPGGGAGSSAGSHGCSGGGHGSQGGFGSSWLSPGTVYGELLDPATMGSGGGGSVGVVGGHGGGAIRLQVAGTLAVSGSIAADGYWGSYGGYAAGGGGAGGSISISAGTLAGNGTIQANGGTGFNSSGSGGSGGGGRIAIVCAQNTFSGALQAQGGNQTVDNRLGGAGTIYKCVGGYASLLIDNGRSGYTCAMGTWASNEALNIMSEITIRGCGVLKQNGITNALRLAIPLLTVETSSYINVSGQGYPGGNTTAGYGTNGPGTPGGGALGGGSGGGGAYGGAGGYSSSGASGGTPYGQAASNCPNYFGSGGGGSASWGATAGGGGGLVQLDLERLVLTGGILANGGNGASASYHGIGAGSGGGIWIRTLTITGNGFIQANGGNCCVPWEPGSGSGGRIALHVYRGPFYSAGGFNGTIQANAGAVSSPSYAGAAGTIVLKIWVPGTRISSW